MNVSAKPLVGIHWLAGASQSNPDFPFRFRPGLVVKACLIAVAILLTVRAFAEKPAVNIPQSMRQSNWIGERGEGSCLHAAMINSFHWQGRPASAEFWRATYSDGETFDRLAAKCDYHGIRYAMTSGTNDVSFLEWSIRTRRDCAVAIPGYKLGYLIVKHTKEDRHAVNLVHLDERYAAILDNRDVSRLYWFRRDDFLAAWRSAGSEALTIVYSPYPPL